jgi:penicillin-binding protein 1A
MGGKTGTTNNNADFWFIGYTPQLLAGAWVGCDDRFIQIESAAYYGGTAARPIWEAFFKKVYEDKSLGIDKEAIFVKPADLHNEVNSADISSIIASDPAPNAEGYDVGVGNADDYGSLDSTHEYIGPESKAPEEDKTEKNLPKKDTSTKKAPKIGEPAIPPADKKEKKGGLFKNIFKKDKDEKKEPKTENDY